MPAGSPSVSAKGAGIALALFIFEHGAAAYLIEILLGALLVALGSDGLSNPALSRRIVGCGLLLRADREHLDSKLRRFGWRQFADLDAIQHFAQLRRKVGGAADDLLADCHISERTREGDAL